MAAGYACAFAAMLIAPVILFSQRHGTIISEHATCLPDEVALSYYPRKSGTGLQVRDVPASNGSVVSWKDFDRDPEFASAPRLRSLFSTLRPPFDIFLTVRNTPRGPQIWFALAEGMDLAINKAMEFCGKPVQLEELNWDNIWHDRFMRVRSAQPIFGASDPKL